MEETSKKVRHREIKFRAWNKYGMSYFTFKEVTEFDGTPGYCRWPEPTEIMQYTGLKDKNGKEIYEGDIFRIEENNGLECDFCDGTGTVEGGTYIETTCEKCNGTGIADEGDRVFHVVITWVHEWAMFCSLLAHSEYESYLREGIKALDEPMFWTYTLEDTDSRKHFLCGNIYEHPHLLSQGEIKTELI